MPRMRVDFESGVLAVEVELGDIRRGAGADNLCGDGDAYSRVTIDIEADELLLVLPDGAEAIVELGVTPDRVRWTRSQGGAPCIWTRTLGRRLPARCIAGRESARASGPQQERWPIS
jgi:hypothetical protein